MVRVEREEAEMRVLGGGGEAAPKPEVVAANPPFDLDLEAPPFFFFFLAASSKNNALLVIGWR